MKKSHEKILREMLSIPTASFREQELIEYVKVWAEKTGIKFSLDKASNVHLELKIGKPDKKRPLYVFHAHLDHPGFVAVSQRGKTVTAQFRGSVRIPYFKGSRVRFFTEAGEVKGEVTSAKKSDTRNYLDCRIKLDEKAPVCEGDIGMWDFPGVAVRGSKLSARGCDDVAGCASLLCCMQDLAKSKKPIHLRAVLTRAEEVGFVSALAASIEKSIPKRALLVGVETSKNQPGARLGDGVVIRVGDSLRTFDPQLTMHLTHLANALTKSDKKFQFCRQLMPGGSTETTGFMMYGYTAAALCLPLGNYHNMHPKGHIAAEQIDIADFENLVKLLTEVASNPQTPADTDQKLVEMYDKRYEELGCYLYE